MALAGIWTRIPNSIPYIITLRTLFICVSLSLKKKFNSKFSSGPNVAKHNPRKYSCFFLTIKTV